MRNGDNCSKCGRHDTISRSLVREREERERQFNRTRQLRYLYPWPFQPHIANRHAGSPTRTFVTWWKEAKEVNRISNLASAPPARIEELSCTWIEVDWPRGLVSFATHSHSSWTSGPLTIKFCRGTTGEILIDFA